MQNRNLLWCALIASMTGMLISLACLVFLIYVLISHGSFITNGLETCQELAQTFKSLSTPYTPSSPVTQHNLPKQSPISLEGIQNVNGKILIPHHEVHKLKDNIASLYTSLRAVPNFINGQAKGLKILSVQSRSFFEQIGIKRGDILLSVNGQMLDVKSGLDPFASLEGKEKIEITLNRQEKNLTLELQIVE